MKLYAIGLLMLGIMTMPQVVVYGQTNAITHETLSGDGIWIDSAFSTMDAQTVTAIVWFENQLLGSGNSFRLRQENLKGWKRSDMKRQVVRLLKELRDQSYGQAKNDIETLEKEGTINDIRVHWIVNGFSVRINANQVDALKNIPGVKKIFMSTRNQGGANFPENGPAFVKPDTPSSFDPEDYTYPWNLEKIGAVETWNQLGITGKGVVNAVHDFGFKLDVPGLSGNLFVNTGEIPDNGKDDDGNGYVDDYHGYNFDTNSNKVNRPNVNARGLIHGNACAAIISGYTFTDSNTIVGVAPESKWAPVIGAGRIEEAVEWAIEQGIDTYSMSFSIPNLGELRSHWRKVMEHGTYAGIFFVSGAGNFGAQGSPNYAAVPHQMRIPEGIPGAVFGIAGLGEEMTRPAFSSQGPVMWDTEHYSDGLVNKPDVVAFNNGFPSMATEGGINPFQARGNSFAGPHVAGVLALMLSANPELLPWDAMDVLIKTSRDVSDQGFDYQTGHGLVDAYEAVKKVIERKK